MALMARRRGRHARPRPPHRLALGAVAVAGTATAVGGVVGLGLHVRDANGGHPAVAASTDPGRVPAPPAATPVPNAVAVQPSQPSPAAGIRPRTLSVPSIGVHSALEPLGLTSTGALAAPTRPAEPGWFTGGSVPGGVGPAVVVGHVDSLTGPAVFSRLSLLRAGDTIDVALSDGRTVRFAVTSVQRYAKDDFPTAAVYGPQPDPQLRLITCGGTFTAHHYLDNVIVFARLASATA